MGYLKMLAVVGVGAAGLLAGVGHEPAAFAKEKEKEKELSPEEARYGKDRSYTHWYIREYQKAQNRIWTFPVQIAVMIEHGPDVLAWCTTCETRWDFKNRTIVEPYETAGRLKDEIRQVRAHVQAFLARKEEIAKDLPEKMAKAIEAADADTEKGAQTGATADFDKGRKTLDKVEDISVLARAVYAPEDPVLKKVEADLKALEGRVAERQKQYWDKTKEKFKRPEEMYKAPDLEEIKRLVLEAWKAKYPKDKVLAVIVPSNANWRGTVAKYNETEKAIDIEDISLLPVRVVVEGEPGWEWVFTAMAVKVGPTSAPTISADVSYRDKLTSPTELIKKGSGV